MWGIVVFVTTITLLCYSFKTKTRKIQISLLLQGNDRLRLLPQSKTPIPVDFREKGTMHSSNLI